MNIFSENIGAFVRERLTLLAEYSLTIPADCKPKLVFYRRGEDLNVSATRAPAVGKGFSIPFTVEAADLITEENTVDALAVDAQARTILCVFGAKPEAVAGKEAAR